MDEFAQTRGGDDLFDDDFTPIPEPVTQTFEPWANAPQRGGRNGYGPRGRGSKRPVDGPMQLPAQSPISDPTISNDQAYSPPEQMTSPQNETDAPTPPPQQPKQPTAVRGDRTATGGITKPKLTEDELSARLAAAKLNNAKRAEAHRLAEADEASFQQREAQASAKRKEEGAARRVMNMERERNRLRKLGAQSGREWDEGKEELDAKQERGSQYRRGVNGGVLYQGGVGQNGYHGGEYNPDFQERGGYRPRGRGGGDRGRGGRGRGGFNPKKSAPAAAPNPDTDFPALPQAPKRIENSQAQPADKEETSGSALGGESWADEVQEAKAKAKAPDDGW
ncbi:hypothetical protein MMC28_002633 [Mycoblastus sanguinarius]|nr:hypothetical protein [Mycoblastus sanguinarius]